MGLSIKDLRTDSNPVYIQDLLGDIPSFPFVHTPPSDKNYAAYAALLTDTTNGASKMVENYNQALAEFDAYNKSPTADLVVGAAVRGAMDDNKDDLFHILTNPDLSDEQKLNATTTVMDKNASLYSPQAMLASRAVQESLSDNQSPEEDNHQLTLASIVDYSQRQNYARQAIYNAAIAQNDPGIAGKVSEFALAFVPGANVYQTASVRSDATKAVFGDEGESQAKSMLSTILGYGSSRKWMREKFNNLPADKQLQALQQVADIINSHPGIVSSGHPDDNLRKQLLQDIVAGRGTSDLQTALDNIFGWVDFAMIGSAAKGALKGAMKAPEAAEGFSGGFGKGSGPKGPTEPPVSSGKGLKVPSKELSVPTKEDPVGWTPKEDVVWDVQPLSPYKTLQDFNPKMARGAYDTILDSEDAARAFTGTDQVSAAAGPLKPEVGDASGVVRQKTSIPDAIQRGREAIPEEAFGFLKHDGLTQYDQAEKAAARAWKLNQIADATAMTPRGEMVQFVPNTIDVEETVAGFSLRGVFGPKDTGFMNPEEALATAEFALRNTGIDSSHLTLLRRQGDEYIPTSLNELAGAAKMGLGTPKDFLVSVDFPYRMDAIDMSIANREAIKSGGKTVWTPLKVKWNRSNALNIIDSRHGLASNWVFDFGSQLDFAHIYGPSLRGSDVAAGLEKGVLGILEDFSKGYKKLPSSKQKLLADEMYNANREGRGYDRAGLLARGFSPDEIDILGKFRQAQDATWFLRNKAYSYNLRKEGWKEFVHHGSDSKLPARPISQGRLDKRFDVYDFDTDTIKTVNARDLAELYKNNGGVAKLHQPIHLEDGTWAEHILYKDSPEGGFLREFTENSQVLNYREGYYHVSHKGNFYIMEHVRGGKENAANGGYSRVVEKAMSIKEAKTLKARYDSTSKTGSTYSWRPARELMTDTTVIQDLSIDQARGLSSFKHRGKLLEDTTSPTSGFEDVTIENPIKTLINDIVQVSKRVALQDVIESQKRRIYNSYSHLLEKNEFGKPIIPQDTRNVKYRGIGNYNHKEIADARASVAYVDMLEHGWVNLLDVATKGAFNWVADVIGEAGLSGAEKVLRSAGEVSLTRGAKATVYHAYIGLSPLRQMFIQGNLGVLASSINPRWVLSGKAFSQYAYILMRHIDPKMRPEQIVKVLGNHGWESLEDAELALTQFRRTGFAQAIDHHTFAAEAVNDMAKQMVSSLGSGVASAPGKIINKGLTLSRKVGFDVGEFSSQLIVWLSQRDKAIREGLDIVRDDVADMVAAKARNFTGAMNPSGDMPSSKSTLGLIFQFTQNPQKMFNNVLFNRGISPREKVGMAISGLMLYGLPTGIILQYMHSYPDSVKKALSDGFMGLFLNTMAGLMLNPDDKPANIAFEGMSPFGAYGTAEIVTGLATSSLGEVIVNAPAPSLIFGGNPRVTNAFKMAAGYFNLNDNYKNADDFLDVMTEAANISSGFSAARRASLYMKTQRKLSTNYKVTDDQFNRANGLWIAFGFRTRGEVEAAYRQSLMKKTKEDVNKDVDEWYLAMKKTAANSEFLNDDQLAFYQKVVNQYRADFGNNEYVRDRIDMLMKNDFKKGDTKWLETIMHRSGMMEQQDLQRLIDSLPEGSDKENLRSLMIEGGNYLKRNDK